MGFYYHCDGSKFFLPVEKVPEAIAALQAWDATLVAQKDEDGMSYYSSSLVPQYDYQQNYDTLDMVASNQHWYAVDRDNAGNIIGIGFDEIKGHDNHEWLEAIALFVRRGSYVQMHDDDGRVYRYVFDGKSLKYVLPQWEMQELANW